MPFTYDLDAIRSRLARELPRGLCDHCERVATVAVGLALRHAGGLDPALAEAAALLHDVARHLPRAEMLRRARDYGIPVSPLDERMPVLLHGPVGAETLRREWDVRDPRVLDAVWVHTFGRESMAPLDKLLFLADKLDPHKDRRYPFNGQVREKASVDLDGALLDWLTGELRRLVDAGAAVHPLMVATRNSLLLARNAVTGEE
ncbi:MAG: bis(5'-nucleosyl)-tetraphosphatase (symmetrical) YqeK [Dehalococcoidia bacterium]|nr:bis(5'-nucleosyl)-tetraphosphatase (symmetrical) YqeK [Dehalococcoidia bacterium]